MDTIIEILKFLYSPSSLIIAGPSMSGKSTLIKMILENNEDLYTKPVKGVLYCHGEEDIEYWESLNKNLVTTHRGMPSMESLDNFIDSHNGEHLLCVFDDLFYGNFNR